MARLTRTAKQAQTRQKLLDAARAVFTTHGFAGTSVDAIADNAGFSKGAFYSNFGSKEELALQVLSHLLDDELRTLEAIADRFAGRSEAVLRALAATYAFRSLGPKAALLGLELLLHAAHDPALRAELAKIYQARDAAKAALLARLAGPGRGLRADASLVADIFSAVTHGHAALLAGGGEPAPISDMIELLLPVLLDTTPLTLAGSADPLHPG
jgi:AcrR family transcriptional regulator